MNEPGFNVTDKWILSRRGKKNIVNTERPYHFLTEKEFSESGKIEDTGVIFLANIECPFHCLMCDLWKNTTEEPVVEGAITRQIEYAISNLPPFRILKLYNSGSFFDCRAVRESEYDSIARICGKYNKVIVESHPNLIGKKVLSFKNILETKLEVAMGLEVASEEILEKLNKKMTPDDFRRAAGFLSENGINVRAFILLKPPFVSEEEAIVQAEKSIDFAFDSGVSVCTIIPVRAGNGAMEYLEKAGYFSPPSIESLEKVLKYGIRLNRGLVFADTWNLEMLSDEKPGLSDKIRKITTINLTQKF